LPPSTSENAEHAAACRRAKLAGFYRGWPSRPGSTPCTSSPRCAAADSCSPMRSCSRPRPTPSWRRPPPRTRPSRPARRCSAGRSYADRLPGAGADLARDRVPGARPCRRPRRTARAGARRAGRGRAARRRSRPARDRLAVRVGRMIQGVSKYDQVTR